MSHFDWERFLKRWSQDIIESIDREREKLSPTVIRSGWLGYAGATEAQIAQAEARLGRRLPPSYRAFLKVTNGWRQTTPFINRLWSVKGLEWLSVRHQAWIDAYLERASLTAEAANSGSLTPSIPDSEYFVYGNDQDCSKIRVEYLQTALEISQQGESAIYLLNPQVVTADGEWEAWFLGDWLPGADRYASFQAMMEAEYENFLELRELPKQRAVSSRIQLEPQQPDQAIDTVESAKQPLTEDWQNLASFALEIQSRQNAAHLEQQTVVRHLETGATATYTATYAEIDLASAQQWILEQLKPVQLLSIQAPEPEAPEPQLETARLEITQLRLIQASRPNGLIADSAHPLLSKPLRANEPFTLELVLQLQDPAMATLTDQPICYRTQCFADDLSTKSSVCLGDIVASLPIQATDDPTVHAAVNAALLPGIRLQPGVYRLKVWVTPQDESALPSHFKIPMLQVV